MKRRKFIAITGAVLVAAGAGGYLLSDRNNFTRGDAKPVKNPSPLLKPDEKEILFLASLAPSGHNTQPWMLKYLEPFHWIIGNDKSRWLPGVDPTQRETILSIGAFLQNLEYAAGNLGYQCRFKLLAANNQDENIVEVSLTKTGSPLIYDIEKIKRRRTVRSGFLDTVLTNDDLAYLLADESAFIHYFPNTSKEHHWLNEQTIEANRLQAYRNDAQAELAEWIRFSSKDAAAKLDGLTMAGMEIDGITAWYLRNFYNKNDVVKKSFREQGIDKVVKQVAHSAGWLLITSRDNTVETLLETGKRLQRLLLKVRDKQVAIHPMTQIIEETTAGSVLNQSVGITEPIQFILRTGYLQHYPEPVSPRRPVEWFLKT